MWRPRRLGKKEAGDHRSPRQQSGAVEPDRLNDWRWEVWGRGDEGSREAEGMRRDPSVRRDEDK